ncbi:MAG TPA: class I SAM-dependent methyltransferase [Terriglobales bacterium]|jgi:spermidine synthase
MSSTLTAPYLGSDTKFRQQGLLTGLALSSFAALLLELALTRLFSVILFYHFAFLAISIALLGLGAGGVFAHISKTWLARFETRRMMATLCAVNAMLIPFVLEIVLHVPVSLEFSRSNFLRLTAIYLTSAVPFFLTGLQFSVIFAREHEHIPRMYGADLAGGAAACLGIVPLLNCIGGPNTIVFAAVVAAAASAVWAVSRRPRYLAFGLAVILISLIAANYSGRWIDVIYAKGLFRDRSWVEFARWNAISRVEVDRQGAAKAVVIDADASTYIMNADPKQWKGTEWEHNLMSAPPAVANILRPHGEYAIIGPGGGVDVLRAVANGSSNVTGIEINPIIADTVMRDLYADYSYHLYQRPEVHIHVSDGRSFIRNSDQQYDVVQMTLVDTWASTAAGAFALSENSLYTEDAFREYFTHLKPDGMLAITRWEFRQPREAMRVVSVAMSALHQLGVQETSQNFIVVSEGDLDEDGIPVAVLAKKTAFTAEEEKAVQNHLAAHPALVGLYLPTKHEDNPFTQLILGNDPYGFAARYPYNVAPVNDNSPFFFFTLKLGQMFKETSLQQGIDWKVNLGVAVLGMVFIISVLAVLAFLIVPLALRTTGGHRMLPLLYFVAVGLGYILVEIAFIQRFVLFLGHPTYALTVVVFLMLLSSGAGSLASRRWMAETKHCRLPLALIIAALLIYVFVLPGILNTLVGSPFAVKLLVSAMILVPLGFAMGMPFPTGLRALVDLARGENQNSVEWAWAMNAASSVLGSVMAMVIAIQFGLNITMACGAGAYLLALMLSRALRTA